MKDCSSHAALSFQSSTSGRERLAALADFLETLPPGVLTFSCWFANGRGCAVGLAAARERWFQAQGLRLADIDQPQRCRPVYDGLSDWQAVAAFFELGFEECEFLFAANSYDHQPTPLLTARRIRSHLSGRPLEAAVRELEPA